MIRLCWWLIETMSRLLEPNERDAVLGDLSESSELAGRALLDVLGLVVRRQLASWGKQLLRSFAGVAIASGFSFYFRDNIYGYLGRHLAHTLYVLSLSHNLTYARPVYPFGLYLKLSIMCGLFLASPYVLWQFWLSVSAGLSYQEKRSAWPVVALSSALFMSGGFFACRVALPAALPFLISHSISFHPAVSISACWDTAAAFVVGVALAFELPGLCWLVHLSRRVARRQRGSEISRH
jgi:sec-independent protein translocase protein TatC